MAQLKIFIGYEDDQPLEATVGSMLHV